MARRQNDYLLTSAGGHLKAVSLSDLDQFMDWQLRESEQGTNPRDLYASVAWAYWAANLRANLVSSIPYKIYTADSEDDEEQNERPFDIDLTVPLWLTEIWLQLHGAAYFLKRANRVKLVDLQCLMATTMRVKTWDADGPLTFEQKVGSQIQTFPASEILYFRTFNPRDDIGPGVAPGQVGQYPSSLVRYANQWAVKFFENGAIPAVLLTTDAAVPTGEIDRIESVWNRALQGVQRAFKTIVLGHGLKAEVIQPPFGELAMPELEAAKREQILAAHQIPPGLAEAKTNRAERDALQYEFYIHWIQPWVRAVIKPALNKQLLNPMGLRIGFDWNSVEVVQAAELSKAESASFMVNGVMIPAYTENVVSVDEVRAVITKILGMAALPLLDTTFTPEDRTPPPMLGAGADESTGPGRPDQRQAAGAASAKAGHPKAPAPSGGPPPELWSDLGKWRDKAQKRGKPCDFADSSIPDWLVAEVKAAMDAVGVEDAFLFLKNGLETRLQIERKLRRKLDDLMPKYQGRMARAIRDGQEPDYDALFDELRAAIQPEITALTTAEAMRTSAELGIAFDPAVINATAVEWARGYSYELVTGLTDTTRNLLRQGASTWYATPGMTLGDLERLLEPAFGPVRSEMIAITETTRAASMATNETQKLLNQTGLQGVRIWNTAQDELVCFRCGPLEGAPESVWAHEFPDGPPAHPNCRCGSSLSFMTENELGTEFAARQAERETWLREQGLWKEPKPAEAGPIQPRPVLRGFDGQAMFADIGGASGRAQGGNVLINRADYQQMSPATRRFVVAHETIHNTVEEYILRDNREWDIAENVLTVETIGSGDYKQRMFVGGHFQFGESISDSIPMAMYDDWPESLSVPKREEVGEWARNVTRRAGYGWDLLKTNINRMVETLDAQL